MFVPKKDGTRRLAVDYWKFNARSKKNVYPLPRPNNLMSKLQGAKLLLSWIYAGVTITSG
jgi:hypothetical protein